jgi:hypothetical protein
MQLENLRAGVDMSSDVGETSLRDSIQGNSGLSDFRAGQIIPTFAHGSLVVKFQAFSDTWSDLQLEYFRAG